MNQFCFKQFIGKGDQGKVLKVIREQDMKEYAAKQIGIKDFNQNLAIELLKLNHPNIVKFHEYQLIGEHVYYLMEVVDGVSFYSFLKQKDHQIVPLIPEEQIYFYSIQILISLQYLHEKNIIYRDLKPENIMLQQNGYIKLIDFDMCKKINKYQKTKTRCGTPLYMAPECVLGQPYNKGVDYWGLGIIIYEMYFGFTPFEYPVDDTYNIYERILKQEIVISKRGMSRNLRKLVKRLLNRNPKLRLKENYLDYYNIDVKDIYDQILDIPNES